MSETPIMKQFLDSLDRSNKGLDEIVRKRLPVVTSCATCTTPGCCSQKLIVPIFEAFPIARELKRMGLDSPELRAHLRAEGDAMDASTRRTWFQSKRPCAFLVGNRCSVYAARPFACRTYVVTTPPANCQVDATDTKVGFVNVLDLLDQLMRRAHDINKMMGLKETKKRIMIGPLPRLVAIVLESWDMPPREAIEHVRIQAWPTDEDIASDWIEGTVRP